MFKGSWSLVKGNDFKISFFVRNETQKNFDQNSSLRAKNQFKFALLDKFLLNCN
jgi:hypothetical protein